MARRACAVVGDISLFVGYSPALCVSLASLLAVNAADQGPEQAPEERKSQLTFHSHIQGQTALRRSNCIATAIRLVSQPNNCKATASVECCESLAGSRHEAFQPRAMASKSEISHLSIRMLTSLPLLPPLHLSCSTKLTQPPHWLSTPPLPRPSAALTTTRSRACCAATTACHT